MIAGVGESCCGFVVCVAITLLQQMEIHCCALFVSPDIFRQFGVVDKRIPVALNLIDLHGSIQPDPSDATAKADPAAKAGTPANYGWS